MRLGNSKGNNTGKKYLMRGKHTRKATNESRSKADKFSRWFGDTHQSLVCELITKNIYDDDVLNETYLRVYENILYANLDVDNYRSYFIRAFFTNSIQSSMQQNRYCPLMTTSDVEEYEPYDLQKELQQKRLEEDIFNYVYRRYSVREFELFKMYMMLKPAVNYQTLAGITHLKVHQIQSVVSKIKKDVCANPQFVMRRRELMS